MIDVKLPVFFNRNRVFRVYKGGKLFSTLYNGKEEDCFYPEEWVASCVKALNKDSLNENEGLSFIENTDVTFKRYLEENKETALGKNSFNILVKILDSAIRLPVQAHPDKHFSRKYFNSEYGKTEAWLVLATREGANISIGFEEEISYEDFVKAIEKSDTDKTVFDNMLHKIPVKSGDLFIIPAKTVHAIGAGCLILEIQEPTDFTIQPERWCGDYKLSEGEMYLGLEREIALKCFDLSICADKGEKLAKVVPEIIEKNQEYTKESLISSKQTDCFILNRYTVKEKMKLEGSELYFVIDGDAHLESDGYLRQIRKGDYFFIPEISNGQYDISGNAVIIGCRGGK